MRRHPSTLAPDAIGNFGPWVDGRPQLSRDRPRSLPFVLLGGFVALLAIVAVIRVRRSAAIVRWTLETMDGSTRWVGGVALVPGATPPRE